MRGHIRKRSADTWSLTVSAGFDPITGKRKQVFRTVRGSEKEAQKELTRLLFEVDTGQVVDPGRVTVAAYLDRWLEHTATRVRPRTVERYAQLLRVHVVPHIGSLRLAKLRPAHVQLVVDKGVAGERSTRTVVHVYRVLSAALRQAVRWQLLPANPAAAVQPPRPPRPELAIIDPEMASRILEASRGTALEIPVTLALATGARRGEILGLAWSDVDLDGGTIRVRRTLQASKSGVRFEEPKTDRSRRTVTLPAFAVEALRHHRKAQAERHLLLGPAWHAGDLVTEQGDGQPIHPDLMTQRFGRFLTRADLPAVRFHDLRHAHATMMLAAGVHPKVVSERLGHGGIGITLDTYSHVIPALAGEAARVIDEVLGG